MSIALWSVLFVALLPVFTVVIAKRSGGGYDNANPRQWAQQLEGFRKRAHAAHQNHYEFFPFFAVAVLIAEWKGGGGTGVDRLALAIILARLLYTASYLTDRPVLRSITWACAWFGTIGMFIMGARS